MKALVPAYSELTALLPAFFLFRSLPTPAAQGDGLEKFKELLTGMPSSVSRRTAPGLVTRITR